METDMKPSNERGDRSGSTVASCSTVCGECNWCNGELWNLGEFGKPRWVCQGCAKRAIEKKDRLMEDLADLVKAYERLLETGRDRIIENGGECDSVEDMIRCSPQLRFAKAELLEGTSNASDDRPA